MRLTKRSSTTAGGSEPSQHRRHFINQAGHRGGHSAVQRKVRCFGHSRKTLSDERRKAKISIGVGIPFTFNQGFQNDLQGNASFLRACFPVLELDPAFVKAIQHLHARQRVLRALRLEETLPGFARHGFMRTGRPRSFVKALAISFGVTRCGPSNSTTRWPLHGSCSNGGGQSQCPPWPPSAPVCRAVAGNLESHPAPAPEPHPTDNFP